MMVVGSILAHCSKKLNYYKSVVYNNVLILEDKKSYNTFREYQREHGEGISAQDVSDSDTHCVVDGAHEKKPPLFAYFHG